MKKVMFAIMGIVAITLTACKSDYEKHMSKFNDCVEEKQEEKKYKYKNIQEALNHYDFDVARDYLACHPSREEVWERGVFTRTDSHTPYKEDLKLIVESEIAYFISQGELEKAEAVAKETGIIEFDYYHKTDMVQVYEKKSAQAFEDRLDKMIENKEYKKIYNFLLKRKEAAAQKVDDYSLSLESYTPREFNATLDKILSKYKYDKVDNAEIRILIDLRFPE
jgi:hypothetical protein